MSDEKKTVEEILETGLEMISDNIGSGIGELQATLRNTNRELGELVHILREHTGISPSTSYYSP